MSKPNIHLLKLFLLLPLIIKTITQNCTENENFCKKCDTKTGLCDTCLHTSILKPDNKGGCIGQKSCLIGRQNCDECDSKDQMCIKCPLGYYPDLNGGCSTTDFCTISYHTDCLLCNEDYTLINLGNPFMNCKSIFSEDFLHCQRFNAYGKCLQCERSYFLNSGDRKCIRTPFCYSSLNETCQSCETNYYLDKKNGNKCLSTFDLSRDFLYCGESEDGITCSKCQSGFYLTKNKKCVKMDHCEVGNENGYYCQQCEKNYFVTKDKQSCVTTKNCQKGRKEKCQQCEENFYLNITKDECFSNQENNDFKYCKQSDKVGCNECSTNYYLSKDIKCTRTKNCEQVINGTCTKCIEKFFLTSFDATCSKVENCKEGGRNVDGGGCDLCEKGYVYNTSSTECFLLKEESDEIQNKYKNCLVIDYLGTDCYKCDEGYYLDKSNFSCKDNTNEDDLKFYQCEETDKSGNFCNKCVNDYYLGKTDHKCNKIPGCSESESPDKCLSCDIDRCFNQKKGTCEDPDTIGDLKEDEEDEDDNEIPGVCYKCLKTNKDGSECSECQEDYFLTKKGKCEHEDGCEEKDENGKCLYCKKSYDKYGMEISFCLNKNFGCVEYYSDGCYKCNDDSDLNKCTECYDGFFLADDSFCYKCQDGCGKCTDDDNCGFCLEGEGYFTIKESSGDDEWDAECGACVDGCKKCNNDKDCLECFEGYYLSNELNDEGNIQCIACSEGCIECQDENYCLTCGDGYEIFSNDEIIMCQKIE